ncbi:hypothetical protein AXG93_223s1120 [Marchantia polymorpha subsp. ruderalis]|uniref:Uncharacterized protein n=1 Tax=Marchantia polymorpha subsp. ruderalis TaxID=1480154 RepID=A0A176W7Z6_MARPO|nr:hypothetical protein AXG93_223s1120 [Marchantia polymorpha subsp. ruderalis]
MEPNIMQQRPGRRGDSLNYDMHEKVMPGLSQRAREAREWVFKEIKDPGTLTMKPRKRWRIDGPQLYVKFTREEGHFALNNLCTLPRYHMLPELRRLQCWYLPKLPKMVHPVCYHPPVPRRRRAHTIFARPQIWENEDKWGRWDQSAQRDTDSELEGKIAENSLQQVDFRPGLKPVTSIPRESSLDRSAHALFHLRSWKLQSSCGVKNTKFTPSDTHPECFGSRKWDLDELRKLEAWQEKLSEPQSLHTSDYNPTSAEESDGEGYSGHGDNLSTDDWWGS